jgi:hypothetical protein
LGPLSTLAQINADGPVGMNRQPGIGIDLCTLTKATLPRPSALSALSAVNQGIYSTLTSQLSEVSGEAECRILFVGGEALEVRKLACAFMNCPIICNNLH